MFTIGKSDEVTTACLVTDNDEQWTNTFNRKWDIIVLPVESCHTAASDCCSKHVVLHTYMHFLDLNRESERAKHKTSTVLAGEPSRQATSSFSFLLQRK